jgi:hypothetical protein
MKKPNDEYKSYHFIGALGCELTNMSFASKKELQAFLDTIDWENPDNMIDGVYYGVSVPFENKKRVIVS